MKILSGSICFALAFSLCLGQMAFAESHGRGQGLPPGIEDNEGLENNGQGETQGNHYGWDKKQKQSSGAQGNFGNRQGPPGQGMQGQMMPPPPHQMGNMGQGQGMMGQMQGCSCPCGNQGQNGQMGGMRPPFPPPQMGEGQGQGRPPFPPPQMGEGMGQGHPMAYGNNSQRPPRQHPGRGGSDIPGNAYGNDQERGNGGQMGRSHSPHEDEE